MHTPRILLVVTSAERMGNAPQPTGYWLEEVAAPYYTFVDAKCAVTIASPLGGTPPLDPTSVREENQTASTRRFMADAKAQRALEATARLPEIDPAQYDAVFFAGGHGTMEDFPRDAAVKAIVEAFYRAGKQVASVCHGPACLMQATNGRGEPIVSGHRFTCFSNAEERLIDKESEVPFLLESTLAAQGGSPSFAAPFTAHVVVDRQLITGQNPASCIPMAETMIYQLRQRMAA